MTHFGILCLAATGHLNTVFPLAHELQQRGHQITIFSHIDAENKAQSAGFNFCDIHFQPAKNTVNQSVANQPSRAGVLTSLTNIRQTLKKFAQLAEIRLQKVPQLIQDRNVDALIVDLSVFEGGTIADRLNLPYITLCCLLPFYQDPAVPPIPTTWQPSSALCQIRNRAAYSLLNLMARPVLQVISRYRKLWNLAAYQHPNDIFSSRAIITRHIPEFEFPRQLPSHFYFTGSFHDSIARAPVAFPFEKLNDKPLIYASMGTLQNRFRSVFDTIAQACADLEVQLVISLGGGLELAALPNLPGNPIVVEYAPQLALLQKANLTITHVGLNTVLESLSYGVPMVAIPVTDDQPGVAARLAWTGAGELIPLSRLNASRLRSAIDRVLIHPSYRQNAARLQAALRHAGGVRHAAQVVEQAIE